MITDGGNGGYSAPDEDQDQTAAPQSRTEAFGHGVNGGPDTASVLTGERPAVPHPWTPDGVLTMHDGQRFSSNGMSEQDAARKFIGQPSQLPMPSLNGVGQSSQEGVQNLRMLA